VTDAPEIFEQIYVTAIYLIGFFVGRWYERREA